MKPYRSTFKITDENGNRYYFEDAETTVSQDTEDNKDFKDWISSWNLSKIITNRQRHDPLHLCVRRFAGRGEYDPLSKQRGRLRKWE
ncbi:MAG: hypothetical protein ACLR8Y_09845 [Alistipes indistinctus]